MKENKRVKILKEETVNEVSLQTLLDLASAAEMAVTKLADNCMKFNSKTLKVASTEVKAKLSSLSDAIRNHIMGNEESDEADAKQPLDQAQSSDSPRLEAEEVMEESDNLGTEVKPKMDELVTEAKNLLKRLIEAVEYDENGNVDTTDAAETMDAASAQASEEKGEPQEGEVIDLREPFENAIAGLDDSAFQGFKSQVVDALKSSGITAPEFQDLVNEIEECENVDDFNYVMDKIYDFADDQEIIVETAKKQ